MPHLDPERRRERQREYRARNPDRVHAWAEAQRERKREYMRRYNRENRTAIAQRKAARIAADKAAALEKQRRYREANRERINQYKRDVRAKLRAEAGKLPIRRAASPEERSELDRLRKKEWAAKNRERVRAAKAESNRRHREKRLTYSREYHRKTYPLRAEEKRAREVARKIAKTLGVPIKAVPTELLEAKLLQIRAWREAVLRMREPSGTSAR